MATPAARRRTDRWVAGGLALAACAGLTALIAYRSAESSAPPPAPEEDRLDAYAEQLTREAARLQAYRQELRRVAEELARGEAADTRLVERIAEETRPPGFTDRPTALDRDASTYSS